MKKLIVLLIIAAVVWFIYTGRAKTTLNKAQDASVNAVKNEYTLNKVNRNLESNKKIMDNLNK